MKIALFGNEYQQGRWEVPAQLLNALAQKGAEVAVESGYLNALAQHTAVAATCLQPDFEPDFAISIGGDGTLLRTACYIGSRQTPILGINMGRLGFLAEVAPEAIRQCAEAVVAGQYSLERRSVIAVTTDGEPFAGQPFALNDVAILKRDTAAMISIRAEVDGTYLTTYQADGLILATPTGSTAYSLSNGGPIIVPGTRVFALTAVAPHSLHLRPIVMADSAEVRLTVTSRSHTFLVAIDGRSEVQREGITLTLRRAPYDVALAHISGNRYFDVLREKLQFN